MVEVQSGAANGGGGDTDDGVGVVLDCWTGDVGNCYVVGGAVVDQGLHCGVWGHGGACEAHLVLRLLTIWDGMVMLCCRMRAVKYIAGKWEI